MLNKEMNDAMTAGFKTLEQFSQDGSLSELLGDTKSFLSGILDSIDSVTLSFRSINGDLVIAQAVVGVLALLVIGITVLPFGATQPSIQASNSVQSQTSTIESYLIQGSLLLSLIVVALSTLLVGRKRIPKGQVAEVKAKLPEVEAARILEMDHERARFAIAELRGAHRMEVLQSIVELGDTPEDIPVVQVPSQEQLELTSCS